MANNRLIHFMGMIGDMAFKGALITVVKFSEASRRKSFDGFKRINCRVQNKPKKCLNDMVKHKSDCDVVIGLLLDFIESLVNRAKVFVIHFNSPRAGFDNRTVTEAGAVSSRSGGGAA